MWDFTQRKFNSSGQSISEYVILVFLVSAALATMTLYIKRGIQGVIKNTSDIVGEQRKGAVVLDYKNPLYNFKSTSEIEENSRSYSQLTKEDSGQTIQHKGRLSTRKGLLSEAISYED